MPLKKQLVVSEDELITKSELNSQTKRLLDVLLRKEKALEKAIAKIEQTYESLISRLRLDHTGSLQELKNSLNDVLESKKKLDVMTVEQKAQFSSLTGNIDALVEAKMRYLDDRIDQIKDGKDADETKIMATLEGSLKAAMEKYSEEKDASTEARILQAERDLRVRLARQRGGFKQLRAVLIDFDGDGSTTSFTLDTEPAAKGRAVWLYFNGQWLQPATHYTIAYKTVNLTFVPENGSKVEGFMFAL